MLGHLRGDESKEWLGNLTPPLDLPSCYTFFSQKLDKYLKYDCKSFLFCNNFCLFVKCPVDGEYCCIDDSLECFGPSKSVFSCLSKLI